MIIKRKKLMELFDKFLEKVEKDDIWYAMDESSLLGTIRHGGMVPWEEKIVVMMTEESYARMRRTNLANIVDSSDEKIKSLAGFFVEDRNDFKREQPFIKIRVLAPTTVKKLRKFRSPVFAIDNLLHGRKNNIRISINALRDTRYEGFLPLESRKQNVKQSWIQSLSMEVVKKSFVGRNVNVPAEYETILKNWYGDYSKAVIPTKINIYKSPILTVKETL